MSFSDDDLKRLKERIPDEGMYVGVSILVDGVELSALIARLETAEKCLETANQEGGIDSNLYEAWRKAAGKL